MYNPVPTYKALQDYTELIGAAQHQEHFVKSGDLADTIATIKHVTRQSIPTVGALAKRLYAPTAEQAAYNVWHWLYTNLRYKLDRQGSELIRTPQRSYADGNRQLPASKAQGIDCEDFSIFAFALLTSMGYRPAFNIVAFNGSEQYGHIFTDLEGFVIDPCPPLERFNQVADHITKTMRITILSGNEESISGPMSQVKNKVHQLLDSEEKGIKALISAGTATEEHRKQLRKIGWLKNLPAGEHQAVALRLAKMVDDISPSGNIRFKRGISLMTAGRYATMHQLKHHRTLQGLGSIDELGQLEEELSGLLGNDLGKLRIKIKAPKIVKKATQAVSKVVPKVVTKTFTKVADKVKTTATKAVKYAVKNPVHVLLKVNPLTAMARNGLLLALRTNLFRMASKLKYGYMTEEEAKAKNLNLEEWRKMVGVREKAKDFLLSRWREEQPARNHPEGRQERPARPGRCRCGRCGFAGSSSYPDRGHICCSEKS